MSVLTFKEYNPKSLAVRGDSSIAVDELKKNYGEIIKGIGGRWNPRMKGGPGWLVPISNQSQLERLIQVLDIPDNTEEITPKSRKKQKKYHREESESEYESGGERSTTPVKNIDALVAGPSDELSGKNLGESSGENVDKAVDKPVDKPVEETVEETVDKHASIPVGTFITEEVSEDESPDKKEKTDHDEDTSSDNESSSDSDDESEHSGSGSGSGSGSESGTSDSESDEENSSSDSDSEAELSDSSKERIENARILAEKLLKQEDERKAKEEKERKALEKAKADSAMRKQQAKLEEERKALEQAKLEEERKAAEKDRKKKEKKEKLRAEIARLEAEKAKKKEKKAKKEKTSRRTSPEVDPIQYFKSFTKKPKDFRSLHALSDDEVNSSSDDSDSSDGFPSPTVPIKKNKKKSNYTSEDFDEMFSKVTEMSRKMHQLEIQNRKLRGKRGIE